MRRLTLGQGLWIVSLRQLGGIAIMKKAVLIALALTTLVWSPALAADLSRPAPAYKALPPPPAQIFTWTGFYLGGNLGGAWAQHRLTDDFFGLNFDTGSNGAFIGGGQVGFNYEFGGGFVLGVEGEFDGAANNHNSVGVFVPTLKDTIAVTSNNRWISTLAARFGWAFNNVLFYGKAGGGWVGNNGFTVTDLTTGTSISGSGNNTSSGWLLGAGIEWAFLNNWTIKFEYDYLGVNSRTFIIPAGAPFPTGFIGDTFAGNRNVQEVKVGFNYLFNWGGPVRY
jgi:outer membrane immunogenic protein